MLLKTYRQLIIKYLACELKNRRFLYWGPFGCFDGVLYLSCRLPKFKYAAWNDTRRVDCDEFNDDFDGDLFTGFLLDVDLFAVDLFAVFLLDVDVRFFAFAIAWSRKRGFI